MPTFTHDDLHQLPRIPRLTLINSISGFKSANLVGTLGADGVANLAIFSSAIHLSSDPALLGIVTRPIVPDGRTSRHTYANIRHSGCFTLNHVHADLIEAAHQTSASYPDGVSEFEVVGLTAQFLGLPNAPYVAESRVKMGLEYVEEYPIRANGTILIVGKVVELVLPDDCLDADGHLDLERAQTVAVSGLDTYHTTQQAARLPYARVAPPDLH
jgi:flavin reductase (DIM6/NTAB) family NADH-FMN oxidoreductase RutF